VLLTFCLYTSLLTNYIERISQKIEDVYRSGYNEYVARRYDVSVHEYGRFWCLPSAIRNIVLLELVEKEYMSRGNAARGRNGVDPINKWLAVNVSVSVTNVYCLAGGDAAPGVG
jgi:hypothetical protein